MSGRQPISETELLVLKALWRRGCGTVRELDACLRRGGRRWAYSTILTLLQRLLAKGYVRSDRSALAHIWYPAISRDQHIQREIEGLADKFCEGTATPLVRAMVEGRRFSREEIAELRDLVDRLEEQASGRGKKRKEV